ncbi:MAG: helix-turn-helix domain-containing protein [Alphaproteobacteria bacterium]
METKLLNTKEAADFLGLKTGTLNIWRISNRYSLEYIKVGRYIRYKKSELERWLEDRTVKGDSND